MKARYTLCFEFEEAAPVVETGLVEASGARKLVWRAVDDAIRKSPGLRWQSLSITLDRKGI